MCDLFRIHILRSRDGYLKSLSIIQRIKYDMAKPQKVEKATV